MKKIIKLSLVLLAGILIGSVLTTSSFAGKDNTKNTNAKIEKKLDEILKKLDEITANQKKMYKDLRLIKNRV